MGRGHLHVAGCIVVGGGSGHASRFYANAYTRVPPEVDLSPGLA
jgi:hypothetical protein